LILNPIGKTAAFLIPLFEKLKEHSGKLGIRAVILSPTRELAMQTHSVAKQLSHFTNLRLCLIVGGSSMNQQFEALSNEPDIIIATPGRLMHHLIEVKFSLKNVDFLVFDEADRLFELGFAFQLHEILKKVGETRQTALFSATLPKQLVEFTRAGLNNPEIVRLDVENKISPNLRVTFYTMRKEEKYAALLYTIRDIINNPNTAGPSNPENVSTTPSTTNKGNVNNNSSQQTLIFAATRHQVEFLNSLLSAAGISCTPVYGQLDQDARKLNIAKFRNRKVDIMIVTDVAARGIDIPLLDNVINFDFPCKPKLFVHRVGRVARAGRSGTAYSFVSPDELPYMIDLHLFLARPLQNSVQNPADYDPNSVYYGNLPRESLRNDHISVQKIIIEQDLGRQLETADRAYGLYYKTRGSASNSSAQRVKELPAIDLHPQFAKNATETELQTEDYLKNIKNYKNSRTIFEVLDHKHGIMQKKRAAHQETIEKKDYLAKLAAKERGSNVQFDEEEQKLAEKHKLELESGELEMAEQFSSDDEEYLQDEFDEKLGEISKTKRGHDEASSSSLLSGNSIKKHKTKAERRAEKKRKLTGDNSVENSEQHEAEEYIAQQMALLQAETQPNNNDNNNSAPSTKRSRLNSFKDARFFISMDRSDEATERGLSLHDGANSSLQTLNSLSFELGGEDAESMMKAQAVQKWDKRKKKYVTQHIGGDPYKKQRNEAGELIRDKDQPDLYAKWQKSQRKTANAVNSANVTEEGEEGEEGEKKRGSSKKKGKFGSNKGQKKHEEEGERRRKGATTNKKPNTSSYKDNSGSKKGNNKGGRAGAVRSELRSADEVRKLRVDKEKNKIKNRKKINTNSRNKSRNSK
jgi:ATP-dependent RNA helicase DDX54/DBP10